MLSPWSLRTNLCIFRTSMDSIQVCPWQYSQWLVLLVLIHILFTASSASDSTHKNLHMENLMMDSAICDLIRTPSCSNVTDVFDMLSAADTPNADSSIRMRNIPICLQRTGSSKCAKAALDTIASAHGVGSWDCFDRSAISIESPARLPISLRRAAAGTTPFY